MKFFLLLGLLGLLATGCGQSPQVDSNEPPEYEWVMTAPEVCSYVQHNLNQKDIGDWYREYGIRVTKATVTRAVKQSKGEWKVYVEVIIVRSPQGAYCYFLETTGSIGKLIPY